MLPSKNFKLKTALTTEHDNRKNWLKARHLWCSLFYATYCST